MTAQEEFLKWVAITAGIGVGLVIIVLAALVVLGLRAGAEVLADLARARAEAMRRYARRDYVLEIEFDSASLQNFGRASARPHPDGSDREVIWPTPLKWEWRRKDAA